MKIFVLRLIPAVALCVATTLGAYAADPAGTVRAGLWQMMYSGANVSDLNRNPADGGDIVEGALIACSAYVGSGSMWYPDSTTKTWELKSNTTAAYRGVMKFTAGITYYFVKHFDDYGYINIRKVGSSSWTSILGGTSASEVKYGNFTPPSEGWYEIDLRVGNGSGAAGPTNSPFRDKPWAGLLWNNVGLTTATAANRSQWHRFLNNDYESGTAPNGVFLYSGVPVDISWSLTRLSGTSIKVNVRNNAINAKIYVTCAGRTGSIVSPVETMTQGANKDFTIVGLDPDQVYHVTIDGQGVDISYSETFDLGYVYFGGWFFDDVAHTLTYGDWVFDATAVDGGIAVGASSKVPSGKTALDFSLPVKDADSKRLSIVSLDTQFGSASATKYSKVGEVSFPPTNIVSICAGAFRNCSSASFRNVHFGADIRFLADDAFQGVSDISELHFHDLPPTNFITSANVLTGAATDRMLVTYFHQSDVAESRRADVTERWNRLTAGGAINDDDSTWSAARIGSRYAERPLLIYVDPVPGAPGEWVYDAEAGVVSNSVWRFAATRSSTFVTVGDCQAAPSVGGRLDFSAPLTTKDGSPLEFFELSPAFATAPGGDKVLELRLPSRGLFRIGTGAFATCTSLTNVAPLLPDTVSFVGTDAFRGVPFAPGAGEVSLVGLFAFDGTAFSDSGCLSSLRFGPHLDSFLPISLSDAPSLTNLTFEGVVPQSFASSTYRYLAALPKDQKIITRIYKANKLVDNPSGKDWCDYAANNTIGRRTSTFGAGYVVDGRIENRLLILADGEDGFAVFGGRAR